MTMKLQDSHRHLSIAALVLALAPGCFEPDPARGSGVDDDDDASSSGEPASGDTTGADDPTTGPGATTLDEGSSSGDATETGTGTDDGSGTGSTTGTGPGEGSSSTGEVDEMAPQVVEITPADGTDAVMDETVTIVFDEPMDTASVEAAFPTATDFVWSEDDATAQFHLPMPFTEAQASFDILVPTSVTDVAGNALEESATASIVLAPLTVLEIDYDASLTGNNTGTWFYAGDTTGDTHRYGGATFDLDTLPAIGEIEGLHRASIVTQVIDRAGAPDDDAIGGFLVDHVTFESRGALANPGMLDAAFGTFIASDDMAAGTPIEVEVTDQLSGAWTDGDAAFQIRVRAASVLDNEASDVLWFRRGADENDSIVAEGVLEPDATHRLRLHVEYFAG